MDKILKQILEYLTTNPGICTVLFYTDQKEEYKAKCIELFRDLKILFSVGLESINIYNNSMNKEILREYLEEDKTPWMGTLTLSFKEV